MFCLAAEPLLTKHKSVMQELKENIATRAEKQDPAGSNVKDVKVNVPLSPPFPS